MPIDPKWIDPETGRLRSYKEVSAADQAAKRTADKVRRLAAYEQAEYDRAQAELMPDLARKVAICKEQLQEAKRRGDASRVKYYRELLDTYEPAWKSEQQRIERQKSVESDPRVKNLREGTASVETLRHLFPHSELQELEELRAISQSSDFPTADSLVNAYNELYAKLHSENLTIEQRRAAELEEAKARASMEYAESQARLAALQAGGDNEQQ